MDYYVFRFPRNATPQEIAARKQRSVADLMPHVEEVAESPGRQYRVEAPPLSDDLLHYLRILERSPGMPATERDRAHGISKARGDRLRKRLVSLGLVEGVSASTGQHGGNFKDYRLTPEAFAVLAADQRQIE